MGNGAIGATSPHDHAAFHLNGPALALGYRG
jgi:hypothetical protein